MMVMLELFDDGAADLDGDDYLSPWNTNQPNPRLLDTIHDWYTLILILELKGYHFINRNEHDEKFAKAFCGNILFSIGNTLFTLSQEERGMLPMSNSQYILAS